MSRALSSAERSVLKEKIVRLIDKEINKNIIILREQFERGQAEKIVYDYYKEAAL